MIKFKRGKTSNWRKKQPVLADGQPGYDKDKHKIKIGDGSKTWSMLPYASGLSREEILNREDLAKIRFIADSEDETIFTYGTAAPNSDTVGTVYLQYYNSDPETDYVISYGTDGIWTYQIWKSGIAKCWGTLTLKTMIQDVTDSEALFANNTAMTAQTYPIPFKAIPTETVSVQSSGRTAFICSKTRNTKTKSGVYSLLSPDKQDKADFYIGFEVCGWLDTSSWNS